MAADSDRGVQGNGAAASQGNTSKAYKDKVNWQDRSCSSGAKDFCLRSSNEVIYLHERRKTRMRKVSWVVVVFLFGLTLGQQLPDTFLEHPVATLS